MITEDFVSFETAKLLKEKGFDADIDLWYDSEGEIFHLCHCDYNATKHFACVQCPTLQMAMKWLREEHNIHITGVPNGIGENVFYMGIYRKYYYGWTCISDCLDEKYKEAEFHMPEEACEAAIKYCLENLV